MILKPQCLVLGALMIAFSSVVFAGAGNDEDGVKAAFTSFQQAMNNRKSDKMWALLSTKSQAETDKAAQAIRAAYAKEKADEKTTREKKLGLTAAELMDLKGADLLKSKPFLDKWDEIKDGKITKITVNEDKALVEYLEPDGDNEKMSMLREKGDWKLVVGTAKLFKK